MFESKEKSEWLPYYATCSSYMTSLHTQLLATLGLQGVLAIGALSAMTATGVQGPLWIGIVGFFAEIILTLFAGKLFQQCGIMCGIMSEIEKKVLKVTPELGIKSALMSTPLFTHKPMERLVFAAGLIFAFSLAIVGVLEEGFFH
jgi:hypothetical protein